MSEEKKIPPGELSLKYMAWDIKKLVEEVHAISEHLAALVKVAQQTGRLF